VKKKKKKRGRSVTNNFEIFPLCEGEVLSIFFCTGNDQNDFLHNDAWLDMQKGYSVAHLVKRGGFTVGFFTPVTDSIETKLIAKGEFPDYPYGKLPAMKIARLATHKEFEREKIGEFMTHKIFIRAYDLARHIRCCVITVDAKVDATGFYEKYAFSRAQKRIYPDTVIMFLNFVQFLKDSFEDMHLATFHPKYFWSVKGRVNNYFHCF
jgi:hypothetical protein